MNILTVEYPDTSTFSEPWLLPCGPRFVRGWIPNSAPNCVIVIVHGLGDHSGRFDAPGDWLRQRGAAVYALDQIGHGQSPGKRMCIPSYDSLLDDLQHLLEEINQRHADLPQGIFGQSMGGNIALNYVLRDRPHASFVVAGSPMLRAPGAPGPIANLFARGLLAIVPDYCLAAPVRVKLLTYDENEQRRFVEDELIQHKVSLRLGAGLIDSGQWALRNSKRLSIPALLMHGDKDEITCPIASKEFAEASNGQAKLKIWKDGLHDLHLDTDRETYMQHMWTWIERQLPEIPN